MQDNAVVAHKQHAVVDFVEHQRKAVRQRGGRCAQSAMLRLRHCVGGRRGGNKRVEHDGSFS
jgi:hypothetical protein